MSESEIVNVFIWDSGQWASGRFSQPKILPALRVAEGLGFLRIKALRYIALEQGRPLAGEPKIAFEYRASELRKIQKSRVQRTAKHLKYKFKDEADLLCIKLPTPEADEKRLFVVAMSPCQTRMNLLENLCNKSNLHGILITPAAFSNESELTHLMKIEGETRKFFPFLPYRLSAGISEFRKRTSLEAVNLRVISGPYPPRNSVGFGMFLSEFALPALDTLISVAGRVRDGTLIYTQTRTAPGLPIILGNWIHESGIVSSVIVAATGHFGGVNFDCSVLFHGTQLDVTKAFRDYIHREAEVSKFTETGHDAGEYDRNGYLPFIKRVLRRKDNDNDNDDSNLLSFVNTQQLLDSLFHAFDGLPSYAGCPQKIQISF